jgi:hypothetical protein
MMSNRKKSSLFTEMLNEYLQLMNSDIFKEVDRRLSELVTDNGQQNSTDTDIFHSTEEFILYILNHLSYLPDESYEKVRLALYGNIDVISEIVSKGLRKSQLKEWLKSDNDVLLLIEYLNYQAEEQLIIKQLLHLLLNKLNGTEQRTKQR